MVHSTKSTNRSNYNKKRYSFLDFLLYGKMNTLDPSIKYIDPPETEKPFAEYYDKNIVPLLKEFEKKRIETLEIIRQRAFMAMSVVIIMGILTLIYFFTGKTVTFENIKGLTVIWVVALVALFVWIWLPANAYDAQVKNRIFPIIFKFISPDCEYHSKSPLTANSLQQFRIIPKFDEEITDDYIKGKYKDVTYALYETELNRREKTGKRRTITIFKGIFVMLSMHKDFKGSTIVLKDSGGIINWLKDKVSELKNVKLEDPKFESFFEVYSSDQVEARYLLTTSFMERLLKLKAEFGDYSIQASFFQNKLLLMIEYYQDLFATSSIMQPATFIEDIETIFRQMENIFQIIDILKLNEQTRL